MTGRFKSVLFLLAAVAFVLTFNLASNAEAKRALITQKIDASQLTTLAGNTRPEVNMLNDRGAVYPDLQLDNMWLLLKRAPELEASFAQFIEEQHNPRSAKFHHWLSADEIGERSVWHSRTLTRSRHGWRATASPSTWFIPTVF